MLSVNHVNYGTLFATMIKGTGSLITTEDEDGNDLPFLTTEEILKQLMKFGFYIEYDVKKNLPSEMLAFLATIDNLGYDKITRIALESYTPDGQKTWRPTVIVMKSEGNTDLLVFDCKVTRKVFNEKLTANIVMNVTHEEDMDWSWLTYIANIEDILDENVDPSDEFDPIPSRHHWPPISSDTSYTEYDSEVVEDDEPVPDQPGSVADFEDYQSQYHVDSSSMSAEPSSGFTVYGSEVIE